MKTLGGSEMKPQRTKLALILVLVILFVSTVWARTDQVKQRGWQYKIVPAVGDYESQQLLNQLGVDGWELVTSLQSQNNPNQVYLYLKRQK
jgi:hypothetical protein